MIMPGICSSEHHSPYPVHHSCVTEGNDDLGANDGIVEGTAMPTCTSRWQACSITCAAFFWDMSFSGTTIKDTKAVEPLFWAMLQPTQGLL